MRSGRSRRTCSPSESTTWSSLRRRSRVPGAQRWAAAGEWGTLPYENATAGEKALMELQKILARFGCQSFGTMTDQERCGQILGLRWRGKHVKLEASW